MSLDMGYVSLRGVEVSAPSGGVSFGFRVSWTAYSLVKGRANPGAANFLGVVQRDVFLSFGAREMLHKGRSLLLTWGNFVVNNLI
jgi:hypothetical protein